MKLSQLPESEFLGLLDKTEEEQIEFLEGNGIINETIYYCRHCDNVKYVSESLPDLSVRLWRQAVDSCCMILSLSIIDVFNGPEKLTIEHTKEFIERWFLYESKPIHRIVAALLALKRAGKEIE